LSNLFLVDFDLSPIIFKTQIEKEMIRWININKMQMYACIYVNINLTRRSPFLINYLVILLSRINKWLWLNTSVSEVYRLVCVSGRNCFFFFLFTFVFDLWGIAITRMPAFEPAVRCRTFIPERADNTCEWRQMNRKTNFRPLSMQNLPWIIQTIQLLAEN